MTNEQFSDLYKQHKDAFFKYCLKRFKGNTQLAEDCLSIATIKAFRFKDQLDDISKFKSWYMSNIYNESNRIYKTTKCLYIEDLQINGDNKIDQKVIYEMDLDGDLYNHHIKSEVQYQILALPGQQKKIMLKYFYNDMTLADVAVNLKMDKNTVKAHYRLGMQKIKAALTEIL